MSNEEKAEGFPNAINALATNLFLSGFTTDPDDVLIRNNGDAAITLILSSQCKGLIALYQNLDNRAIQT